MTVPTDRAKRTSSYRIVEVKAAEELKGALSAALGIRVVVVKTRRLYLWEGVRIHLDAVEGLGDFLEFEAVAPPESDLSTERDRVALLRDAFQIAEADLIAVSYSDLLPRAWPALASPSVVAGQQSCGG
jgi:predicted adenylyl cyclase CyaB